MIDRLSGTDASLKARLARMRGPEDLLTAYRSLEQQMSSGAYKKALPTRYTDQELAEYKRANGIPDKAEDYDTALGNGIVWGEADKPHIDNFTKYALENNMTPDEVKKGLGWWASYQNDLVAQVETNDEQNATQGRIQLRSMWGADQPKNLNFIKTKLDGYGPTFFNDLMNARLDSGVRFGDNPQMLNMLLEQLNQADPYGRELPGGGVDAGKTLDAELAELNVLMADKSSRYWRGDQANDLQARWRTLYELTERNKQLQAAQPR
jgi:hypothetical protein